MAPIQCFKINPPIAPYSGSIKDINPRIESIKVWHTTESSILVQTKINFTNPTKYSATIPLADFMILHNGTAVAQVLARNLSVAPGLNSGIRVDLLWNPKDLRGERGETAGRDMLSRYVSGLLESAAPFLSFQLTVSQDLTPL